jgi:hypothetical protein
MTNCRSRRRLGALCGHFATAGVILLATFARGRAAGRILSTITD